ncbi:aspartyl-phosphate phosphatase Spo0E family protein [Priestia endophytica]|jgi:hypothetical protein|uniref:Spo0E like sporulation regulatory protein n=1 Tax=Priestia endophytica DSM 13796 TaxID=1121089 RepID=A0A1I5XR77_9BACI|nr:aspartyl-phosphate phosphatase Spo0E family protein [Priestia endophytica]KYG31357.1 hypothetical protein AZF06_06335 [Priestia endophytica]RAS81576.1 aspartyl-phosphate phosphatase Spo0E family protein [Priestia endophytica]SFQ34326.1 Spo0E like sporulation regulatory protein [Priestia endophytica DSM 13796]
MAREDKMLQMYSNGKAEALLGEILHKRQEMCKLAEQKGYTHKDTIVCSQELDELLNRYQRCLEQKQEDKRPFFTILPTSLAFSK